MLFNGESTDGMGIRGHVGITGTISNGVRSRHSQDFDRGSAANSTSHQASPTKAGPTRLALARHHNSSRPRPGPFTVRFRPRPTPSVGTAGATGAMRPASAIISPARLAAAPYVARRPIRNHSPAIHPELDAEARLAVLDPIFPDVEPAPIFPDAEPVPIIRDAEPAPIIRDAEPAPIIPDLRSDDAASHADNDHADQDSGSGAPETEPTTTSHADTMTLMRLAEELALPADQMERFREVAQLPEPDRLMGVFMYMVWIRHRLETLPSDHPLEPTPAPVANPPP
ncbi:hypothetical protein PtA15_6A51 [Puccinia triticina]|uniref:Uncharacterized protein n=1 Tax=Puccinia triticina TaxID=208348 RepID=A0ABY7CM64_9BASI|nr:uncharacterized protein PtA15_6A51 [Puccinia triticina]WAQ85423.1 hypothetical protein PtA15_6A51 [Puccinia triticina]